MKIFCINIIWLYLCQDEEQIDKLKKELVTPLLLLDVFSWLLIGLGIALTAVGSILFICKKWYPVSSINDKRKEIFQLDTFAYPTLFQWQSTKRHISLDLMTCSFSWRLVTSGLFCQKHFVMESKKKKFYCVRFCQCASTELVLVSSCGLWLSLHDLLWSEALSCPVLGPVTITWDRKNAIRDMPCFKLSLPYSLWECCVMFTLIRDIDIRPNHLSLAIIFLIP